MTKTNSLKKVPMKYHRYYDNDKGEWIVTGFLTHFDYVNDNALYESYVDETGGLRYRRPETIYIDNIPFEKTLTYDGFYRGRSAAGMIFIDENNVPYTVFLKEFEKMVPIMVHGKVTGKFWYVKRGTNFGIGLVDES